MVAGGDARTFGVVRPLCVTLLRHTSAPQLGHEVTAILDRITQAVHEAQREAQLAPALIHYIFYPLSQLMCRDSGLHGLSDRLREAVFRLLGALARDWWCGWTLAKVQPAPYASLRQVAPWQIWEQLLLLGVMALASSTKNSDATAQAIAHFLIELLQPRSAKVQPGAYEWDGESDLPPLEALDHDAQEWQVYPAEPHTRAARDDRACVGALSHILKLALDTSLDAARPIELRGAMLDVASVASMTWLVGDTHILDHGPTLSMSRMLAFYATSGEDQDACSLRATPILPGIVSSTSKLIAGRAPAPGTLVARAFRLLTAILLACLADVVTAPLRPTAPHPVVRLEDFGRQLAELVHGSDSELETASGMDTPATSVAESETPSLRTPAWLERTMHPVLIAIYAFEVGHARDYAEAQHAMIDGIAAILERMPKTLAAAWHDNVDRGSNLDDPLRRLVRHLLDLGSTQQRSRVMQHARYALETLVVSDAEAWMHRMGQELALALDTLPGAMRGVHDAQLLVCAQRIETIASLVAGPLASAQLQHPHAGFLAHFRAHAEVNRWGAAWATALSVHHRMASADADPTMPPLLRPHVAPLENGSIAALDAMFTACGHALASLLVLATHQGAAVLYQQVFAALLFFVNEGCSHRTLSAHAASSQRHSVACLFAAHALLQGTVTVLATPELEARMAHRDGRLLRKPVHGLARAITQCILEAWSDDHEEELATDPGERAVVPLASDAPDMHRGFPLEPDNAPRLAPGKALDVAFVESVRLDAAPKPEPERQVTRTMALGAMGDALLLSLLAGSAALLGTAFRSQLLHGLYPLLSAMGSDQELVRSTARHTLDRIAYACAYPSAASCVLHHADYVLGTASHRLVAGLRAELRAGITQMQLADAMHGVPQGLRLPSSLLGARAAPWVLVQVLEMLGPEAVPMVEDAVDEVLDALDRFHGYDEISDGLLAVLARLVHVLAREQPPMIPLSAPPPRDPLAAFTTWLNERHKPPADAVAPDEDRNDEPNPPASRLQTVVTQIVSRCIPFLSHGSVQIRARALDMLSDGVRILASQHRTADLYPVLHRAWPLVMARLGINTTQRRSPPRLRGSEAQHVREALPSEQDAHVWIAATKLVGAIGEHASDVFGKPIVEQAWPRWTRLLYVLEQLAKGAPQARALPSCAQGDAALAPRFDHHRFHVYDPHAALGQVLCAVADAVRKVLGGRGEWFPSDVLWSMATHPVLLDTLDMRQAARVRDAGLALFRTMAKTDANLVWVVLRAVSSDAPPAYLHRDPAHLVSLAPIWV